MDLNQMFGNDDRDNDDTHINTTTGDNISENVTSNPRHRRILRIRNRQAKPGPPNVEEQIIRNRGRRQWEKVTPRTPPNRKRPTPTADDPTTITVPQPNESPFTKCLRGLLSPIPVRERLPSDSSSQSVNITHVLSSTEAPKRYYYSPNRPYNLRSTDMIRSSINNSNSSNTSSQIIFNDSGIGMSPDLSGATTTEVSEDHSDSQISLKLNNSTTEVSSQTPSSNTTIVTSLEQVDFDAADVPISVYLYSDSGFVSSSSNNTTTKRINRVRRRFRF